MSERLSVGEFAKGHWKAALIAGVTMAAGTAAVAGARAVRSKRRNRVEDEPLDSELSQEDMTSRLGALYDPEIPPTTRNLLAGLAARVFYATHYTESNVITADALSGQYDADRPFIVAALTYMEEAGLVGQRESSTVSGIPGYFAEAPLSWALTDDDENSYPELHQALSTILCDQ